MQRRKPARPPGRRDAVAAETERFELSAKLPPACDTSLNIVATNGSEVTVNGLDVTAAELIAHTGGTITITTRHSSDVGVNHRKVCALDHATKQHVAWSGVSGTSACWMHQKPRRDKRFPRSTMHG